MINRQYRSSQPPFPWPEMATSTIVEETVEFLQAQDAEGRNQHHGIKKRLLSNTPLLDMFHEVEAIHEILFPVARKLCADPCAVDHNHVPM